MDHPKLFRLAAWPFLAFAAVGNAADWPCWRGPTGSGVYPDSGVKLAPDPKDFKLLWKSAEQDLPSGWLHPNGFGATGTAGGFGGPMYCAGHVYLAWYVPSGDKVEEAARQKAKDQRPEKWRVDADDVLLCADAATGKTLWKAVLKGRGANHQYHMHCPLFHPVAAAGKVYLLGSGGWVYCLDAASGALVWEARLGAVTDAIEKWKQAGCTMLSPAAPKNAGPNVDKHCFDSCPAVADGVVACNSFSAFAGRGDSDGHALIAFDAQTGKELWTVPGCINTVSSPVVWVHKGKTYFVAAGSKRAVALAPKTGALLWEIKPWLPADELTPEQVKALRRRAGGPARLTLGATPAVDEGHLVLQGTASGRPDSLRSWDLGLTCWRITPEGTKLLWTAPPSEAPAHHSSPCIYRGHVFTKGKCFELTTGKLIGKAGEGNFGSPVASDGVVIGEGALYFLGPDGSKQTALRIPWEPFTTAAIAEGRLYVRGQREGGSSLGRRAPGAVYCYDLREQK
jgi:outer membrane protein assembly factor BamB